MYLVDNTDFRFPGPVAVSGPRSLDPGPLLPSTTEHIIIKTSSAVNVSHSSTPTTSRPSTPVAPSPPSLIASLPPATDDRENYASPPQSSDHQNLGHAYSTPSLDPRGRRSAALSV